MGNFRINADWFSGDRPSGAHDEDLGQYLTDGDAMFTITARKPSSPGEILKEEFMAPAGLTQEGLADAIHVERRWINEIVGDKRGITPDTAIRLGRYFGVSARFWMNLQARHNLWHVLAERRKEYERIKPHKARLAYRPVMRKKLHGRGRS